MTEDESSAEPLIPAARVIPPEVGIPAAPAIPSDPVSAAEPLLPPVPAEPVSAAPPPGLAVPIPLATTRGLLAASFDLLLRSGKDMRRASFYIGAIVLGTVGPVVLAEVAIAEVANEAVLADLDPVEYEALFAATDAPIAALVFLALFGFMVALVESRTMATAVLGGHVAGRPISIRAAVARSRRTFWRAIVASVVVAIPVAIAQSVAAQVVQALLNLGVEASVEASVITSTLVSAVVGGPFAYVLAGVVLGDVDAFESVRRSFRVFRARKVAAAVVAVFETITALLLILGLSTGLDVVFRVFNALGLGIGSGTAGVAVTMIGVVAIVFASGTLLFTVMAITIAPQVVMFVGLTHATIGLDLVRSGGLDDPEARRPGVARFRWFTLPMLFTFALGAIVLGLVVASLTD